MNVEAVCDGCKGVGKVLRFSGIEVSGASCVSCYGAGTVLVTLTPAGEDAVIRARVESKANAIKEIEVRGYDATVFGCDATVTVAGDDIIAALGVTAPPKGGER